MPSTRGYNLKYILRLVNPHASWTMRKDLSSGSGYSRQNCHCVFFSVHALGSNSEAIQLSPRAMAFKFGVGLWTRTKTLISFQLLRRSHCAGLLRESNGHVQTGPRVFYTNQFNRSLGLRRSMAPISAFRFAWPIWLNTCFKWFPLYTVCHTPKKNFLTIFLTHPLHGAN